MNLIFERKKVIIILFGITIFLLFFISALIKIGKKTSLPTTFFQPPLSTVSPINNAKMTIGEDMLSPKDLSDYNRVFLPNQDLNTLATSEQNYLQDMIEERSIVLQEAIKRNLITADSSLFSVNKDWEKYNQKVEEAKQAILSQVEQISVAGIFMYFYNDVPPSNLTIREAKEFTRQKMEALRKELTAGKITIRQAADLIRQDESLASIDEIYYANAYGELIGRTEDGKIDPGISEENNNLLWQLQVGEISLVLLGYEAVSKDSPPRETYWVIYQVTDKHGSEKPYLWWLAEKRKEYAQKNY